MKPNDMQTLETERLRGREADEILNAPIFREAWEEASKAITAQRRKCGVKDTELAMKLIMAEQTLGIVRDYIENLMKSGKFADVQLDLETQRVNWLNRLKTGGFSRF